MKDKIKQLCDSWVAAAQLPSGGFAIGATTEQYRLHRNGISFHELSYEESQAACLGLSQALLLRGMNTVIDLDHKLFWAWAGEMLLSPRSSFFKQEESEIRQLFEVCIRASLAGITRPTQSKEDWERQRELNELIEFNTKQLVLNSHLILAYLAPALLEGILKKVCQQFVDYSGKVLTPFDVPPRNVGGSRRQYVPSDPRKGRCSSLRDLLFLLYGNVSDPDLKKALDGIRQQLSGLDSNVDPFELIYSWRNGSLHGQSSFPTIGGTLLNIVTLIAFNHVKTTYDQQRSKTWAIVKRDMESSRFSGHGSPWSFYPPF